MNRAKTERHVAVVMDTCSRTPDCSPLEDAFRRALAHAEAAAAVFAAGGDANARASAAELARLPKADIGD